MSANDSRRHRRSSSSSSSADHLRTSDPATINLVTPTPLNLTLRTSSTSPWSPSPGNTPTPRALRYGSASPDGVNRVSPPYQFQVSDTGLNKIVTNMVIGPLDDRTYWCSVCVHSFGALAKAVRMFFASLYNQLMYPKVCSTCIGIFINL